MYSAIFSYPVYSDPPRDANQRTRMSSLSMEKKAPRSRESSQLSRSSSHNTRGSGHYERNLQPPSQSQNKFAKLLNKHRNRHRTEERPIDIVSQRYSESGQKPMEDNKQQNLAPPVFFGSIFVAEDDEPGPEAAVSREIAEGDGLSLLYGTEAPVVLGRPLGESQKAPVQHSRGQSLHVNWTLEDVDRMAREIFDETIADVHLSLFGYWIREQPDNYDVAKTYIRELSLDQGYNVERITNVHLRKLLRDVRDIRPKERSLAPEQLLEQKSRRSSAATSNSGLNPPTAKLELLPPAFRAERERAIQKSQLASPITTPSKNYPPNTPDRPEPLSLKSTSSATSKSTLTAAQFLRSVSSPLCNSSRQHPSSLPLPRNSIMFQDTASHPLLVLSKRTPGQAIVGNNTDDVFGIGDWSSSRYSEPLTAIRVSGGERNRHDIARRYASTGHDAPQALGPYELDAFDASSDANEDNRMCPPTAEGHSGERAREGRESVDLHNSEASDAMESYVGSEDEISILESASVSSNNRSPTRYSYASSGPPPSYALPSLPSELVLAPAPTRRHTTTQTRRKIQGPNPIVAAPRFHRPLPLRSYESEAHLYPTSRAQGASGHNRANSAGSMQGVARSVSLVTPHQTEAIPLPVRSSSLRLNTTSRPARSRSISTRGHSSHFEYLSPIEDCEEATERSTNAFPRPESIDSSLASFPMPPTKSTIGEILMYVSRASTPMESITNPIAKAEAFRIFTKICINDLLFQSRLRGLHLMILDWDTLPPFERTWRDTNEELLVAIYGRKDTMLSDEDVQYLDSLSRELRASSTPVWVRQLFRDSETF